MLVDAASSMPLVMLGPALQAVFMAMSSLVQPCARCRHVRACAGSFPGMWYYLSLFYCDKDLGMAYSWVSVGTAFSQVTAHMALSEPTHMLSQTREHSCASFHALRSAIIVYHIGYSAQALCG